MVVLFQTLTELLGAKKELCDDRDDPGRQDELEEGS